MKYHWLERPCRCCAISQSAGCHGSVLLRGAMEPGNAPRRHAVRYAWHPACVCEGGGSSC